MIDVIIVGQGLVGSLLAIELIKQGKKVVVIDNNHKTSSTKIAAGIMNPIVGQRLTLLWENSDSCKEVISYYREVENKLKTSFLKKIKQTRILTKKTELEFLEKRRKDPKYNHLISSVNYMENSKLYEIGLANFEVEESYRLDTQEFLEKTKVYLKNRNLMVCDEVKYSDIIPSENDIQLKALNAKNIVFCEGFVGKDNPFFKELKFKNAHGHILEIENNELDPSRVLNHGKWLCPIGENKFKYGSTSYWEDSPKENKKSKEKLKESLNIFLKSKYSIVKCLEGVRPAMANRVPFFGRSGMNKHIWMINGLGGQGVSQVPKVLKLFLAEFLIKN